MRSVPLWDAEARLHQLADEVDRTHEHVHLTKDGHEYVVLVSAQDLASMEATLELLFDPEAPERLRWAEAEVDGGDVVEEDELRSLLDRLRRR